MQQPLSLAPELQVQQWLNTEEPLSLQHLRGRVVVMHAFQMLCPGCVSHGLPQAASMRKTFSESELTVIGLHSVFEHHAVMGADALRAFIHEYAIAYPVAIDQADTNNAIPRTMQAYALRGTPSLILIDRQGRIRLNHFGIIDDLQLGAIIGQLLTETNAPIQTAAGRAEKSANPSANCDDGACPAPD